MERAPEHEINDAILKIGNFISILWSHKINLVEALEKHLVVPNTIHFGSQLKLLGFLGSSVFI